ncbi:hypothetical protein [Haliangium sp. UPWRP_2]|uniref:hypothetical protein n=1 Tax=Haliangium sp. UPWRP_2 TaxID=1931276 RepID=UPI000B545EEF|nr:hypothetical protein [Haliangium sp. UPWRP_2]PSM31904.1 hypothetical protein BVG81_003005 [Haliangium sp. UPWRP_2]
MNWHDSLREINVIMTQLNRSLNAHRTLTPDAVVYVQKCLEDISKYLDEPLFVEHLDGAGIALNSVYRIARVNGMASVAVTAAAAPNKPISAEDIVNTLGAEEFFVLTKDALNRLLTRYETLNRQHRPLHEDAERRRAKESAA